MSTETKKPKGQHGGWRPNSGRPRKRAPDETNFPADVVAQCTANPNMMPLDYMLKVMRNPEIDPVRRDRMAVAAAPYCHGKLMDQYVGKKETQAKEANTATDNWMRDLAWIKYRGERDGEKAARAS